jgi:hypothetical protein
LAGAVAVFGAPVADEEVEVSTAIGTTPAAESGSFRVLRKMTASRMTTTRATVAAATTSGVLELGEGVGAAGSAY